MEMDGARGGIANVRASGSNRSKGLVTRSDGLCFGHGGARRSSGDIRLGLGLGSGLVALR